MKKNASVLPADATRLEVKGDIVLALGEVTGHSHRFAAGQGVAVYERPTGERYIEVTEPAVIDHEEHGQQLVQPGIYEVVIQEVLQDEEWRPVID